MKVLFKPKILNGFFMILFLAVAAVMAGFASIPALKDQSELKFSSLLHGTWTKSYEKKFTQNFIFYQPALASWGSAELALFHEGRSGVLIGNEGWLFSSEEFEYYKNRDLIIATHLKEIYETQTALKNDNVALIIALIPSKTRMQKSHLGRYTMPFYNADLYTEILQNLKNHQGIIPNLAKSLADIPDNFLHTDTHWTPQAANETANILARTIKFSFPALRFSKQEFKNLPSQRKIYEGDLMRYIPAGNFSNIFGITPDIVKTYKTENSNKIILTEDDLFKERNIDVVLVGTSYSANPLWNFEGALKTFLKTDILNASREGRGPFETMKEYRQSVEYQSHRPKLIIWEIPERYVPLPDPLTP